MQRNTKILIGCGVFLLMLICVAAAALASGLTVFALLNETSSPFSASIRINPALVNSGENFELLVTVRNESQRVLRVNRLSLPEQLLTGTELVEAIPVEQAREGSHLLFDLAVLPEQAETIRLLLNAQIPGDYAGDITVEADGVVQQVQARVLIQKAVVVVPTTMPAPEQPLGEIPFPAVVQIFAMVREGGRLEIGWSGSGSIISADGLILTNAHVVLPEKYFDLEQIQVGLTTQIDAPPERTYVAEVLQADPQLDIAVIRIIEDLAGKPIDFVNLDLPVVPLGDSEELGLGDPIIILGYPGIGGDTITVTNGEVSGFTGEVGRGNRAYIKTSATIAGGNSGGLAVNSRGELIGVPTQLGYGGEKEFVDCRVLADTNRDGVIDDRDSCVSTGGFINALRPISLAVPLIDAALRGEINIGSFVSANAELPQGENILFQDDFSDPRSGWDIGGDGYAKRSYADGEYQIEVTPDNYYAWSNPGLDFWDVLITVDVRSVRSEGTGDYGVLCRYTDDENFYALELSEDGYYAIWKAEDGEYYNLVEWTYSEQIPQAVPVTLTAACVGNELTLAVGDIVLAQVTDNAHRSGDLGLVAGTWDSGDQILAFDNFEVRAP
jgi:S1-C subfamily serine protease